MIAACYGGGFDELLAPGRVLTAGAGPGQLAYENDDYGRSYLAEFVLRRALRRGRRRGADRAGGGGVGHRAARRHHPSRQVWNVDEAGHVISLDGMRRDDPPRRRRHRPRAATAVAARR